MTALKNVCWALARECRNDDVIVVGVATPMAAAAAFLARELLVPDLTILLGGAVDPPTIDVSDLILDPLAASAQASTTLGQRELLPLLQNGSITLQFVSPAQVDRTGAINTSRVLVNDQWRKLPGCLALPDTAALVGRLVAYRVEGGDRFIVNQVDHVTGMGRETEIRSQRGLSAQGVVAVITEAGHHELSEQELGAPTVLEDIPSEAINLLTNSIDKHSVLGIESRSERAEAYAKLGTLTESMPK